MAFDSLSEKLQDAFKSLKGKGKITEEDVNLALRQVRTALLEADVNFMVAKDFVKSIKEKALGEEVFGSLNPAQTVIKIVNDELTALLGGTQSRIMISSKPPTIIMLVGGLLEIMMRLCVPPNKAVNSSFTILITVCAGFKEPNTSSPRAFSLMDFTKSFATIKLTSASNSAVRT